MLLRGWLARVGSRRVDRRQAGLLGAALLALCIETEPAEARRRRNAKSKSKSKKRSQRAQSEKERGRRTPRFCGGIAGIPCPDGFTCVDDPRDDCDPKQGGADCGGICVRDRKHPRACGGIAGIPCPKGYTCVDDPSDDCDPKTGGADCGGICVRKGGEPCGKNRCGPREFCCNLSCGECAPIGGGCTDRSCPPDPEPWPGGEPCGRTICPRGQVCCNASCGVCTPPGGACPMIACVEEIPE